MFKFIIILTVIISLEQSHSYLISEEDEIDYTLAGIFRGGDPERLWPTSLQAIKREFCDSYIEEILKVINYGREKYPDHVDFLSIMRLAMSEWMRVIHSYCENPKILDFFRVSNSKVHEQNAKRIQFMRAIQVVAQPNSGYTMGHLICLFDEFRKQSSQIIMSAITAQYAKTLQSWPSFTSVLQPYLEAMGSNVTYYCDPADLIARGGNLPQAKSQSIGMAFFSAAATLVNR